MKLFLLLFSIISIQSLQAQTQLTSMPLPDRDVWAIQRIGNTVFIGGDFTNVNGVARNHIASFDALTGALNSWSPNINRSVSELAIAGGKLIVAGTFDTINGQYKTGICMFDIATGNLLNWSAPLHMTPYVNGLAVFGNLVYYSAFTPSSDMHVLCIDALTGTSTSFQSDAVPDDIDAIARDDNYMYCGANGLHKFDANTGVLDTTFHPALSGNAFIKAIFTINGLVYVGGSFTAIGGQSRNGLAAFDSGGNITNFTIASSSSQIWSMFPADDYLWVGGNSHTYGSNTRWRMAEMNIATQNSTCWDPSSVSNNWSFVNAIFVSGDTVYAGPSSNDYLTVFVNSPRPHPGPMSGPAVAAVSQTASYSIQQFPGYTYHWTVSGGTGTSATNTINVTWGAGPAGTVSVIVNNPINSDCSSDTVSMIVNIGGTSINKNIENDFAVYPNPVKDHLFIKSELKHKLSQIEIYDCLGNKIAANKFRMMEKNKNTVIDVSEMPTGIYLLKITFEDNNLWKKIIKI